MRLKVGNRLRISNLISEYQISKLENSINQLKKESIIIKEVRYTALWIYLIGSMCEQWDRRKNFMNNDYRKLDKL